MESSLASVEMVREHSVHRARVPRVRFTTSEVTIGFWLPVGWTLTSPRWVIDRVSLPAKRRVSMVDQRHSQMITSDIDDLARQTDTVYSRFQSIRNRVRVTAVPKRLRAGV